MILSLFGEVAIDWIKTHTHRESFKSTRIVLFLIDIIALLLIINYYNPQKLDRDS